MRTPTPRPALLKYSVPSGSKNCAKVTSWRALQNFQDRGLTTEVWPDPIMSLELPGNFLGEFIAIEEHSFGVVLCKRLLEAPFVHDPWSGVVHGKGAAIMKTTGRNRHGGDRQRQAGWKQIGILRESPLGNKMFLGLVESRLSGDLQGHDSRTYPLWARPPPTHPPRPDLDPNLTRKGRLQVKIGSKSGLHRGVRRGVGARGVGPAGRAL